MENDKKYNVGDVVTAGHKSGTIRILALVNEKEAVPIFDAVGLTSQNKEHINSAYLIKKNELNNLKYSSYANTREIYELNENDITKKIGKVDREDLTNIRSFINVQNELGLVTREPFSRLIEKVQKTKAQKFNKSNEMERE